MVHIFIINSNQADKHFSEKLKEHLKERDDLKFFVFNTSHAGMEAEIAQKMVKFFGDEIIRFYCCGGSGTFRNIFNTIVDFNNFEMAFYPCGATNDFLKIFGDKAIYFKDIDNLIDGRVENMDYIKTTNGVAVNTVSFGVDTKLSLTLESMKSFEIFGAKIPYLIAYTHALTGVKHRKLHLVIDRETHTEDVNEMIIGNGSTLGGNMRFTDEANPRDGILDYIMSVTKYDKTVLQVLLLMLKGDLKKLRKYTDYGKASYYEVSTADGKDIYFNLDGEIVKGGSEWTIEVVKEGLKFVVPNMIAIY